MDVQRSGKPVTLEIHPVRDKDEEAKWWPKSVLARRARGRSSQQRWAERFGLPTQETIDLDGKLAWRSGKTAHRQIIRKQLQIRWNPGAVRAGGSRAKRPVDTIQANGGDQFESRRVESIADSDSGWRTTFCCFSIEGIGGAILESGRSRNAIYSKWDLPTRKAA